jgi:hypothetical protein
MFSRFLLFQMIAMFDGSHSVVVLCLYAIFNNYFCKELGKKEEEEETENAKEKEEARRKEIRR